MQNRQPITHYTKYYALMLSTLLCWATNSYAMPANDAITEAILIDTLPTTVNLTVSDATQTAAEPLPSCNPDATASVWYRYVATETAAVHVTTFGSKYDTVLSAWRGTVDNLTELACNDDDNGILQSRIKLEAQANQTYYLNISGVDITQANLQLHLTPIAELTNDTLDTPLRIFPNQVPDFQHVQTVQAATVTFAETLPSCAQNAQLNRSVWFRYRANRDQQLVFSTFGSSYDTVLAVWTGSANALTEVACNDDGSNAQSQLSLNLTDETIYYLSVMKKNTASLSNADNVLVLNITAPVTNDDLTAAVTLDAVPTVITQNTGGATLEPQEQLPSCNPDIESSVWLALPANTAIGNITFYTTNITFNSVLSIWQGDAHPLTEVACNDDSTALDQSTEAQLTAQLQPDVAYYINVAGVADSSGPFELHIEPAVRDFAIAQAPQPTTVLAGQAATLSVLLENSAGDVLENSPDVNNQWETLVNVPFTYQWYEGDSGDTGKPVPGDSFQLVTPPLLEATTFWVRVTNPTGTQDSAAAPVQVIAVDLMPDTAGETPNGVGIDAAGNILATQAHFTGVISVIEGDSGNPLAARQQDTLAIVATIQVDPAHVGQTADISMVAQYLVPDSALFYHRQPAAGAAQVWDFWDGGLPSLAAVDASVTLTATEANIPIFVGQLQGLPGEFRVFIGYRLVDSGEVFYNGIPIVLTID